MGFFSDKCKECKSEEDVQMCQFCRKMICKSCLKRLAYKEETPKWFVGKKVKDFGEYKELNLEYCKLLKNKGAHIHCCDAFLQEAWRNISKQVKRLEHDRDQKAAAIILK